MINIIENIKAELDEIEEILSNEDLEAQHRFYIGKAKAYESILGMMESNREDER